MHSLVSPQVTGCMLVSSSNRLWHINSPLPLSSSHFSWFPVFFFLLYFLHKTLLSFAQLQRLNGLSIDCSFLMHRPLQRNTKNMSSPRLKRSGWRVKREGGWYPKSGIFLTSSVFHKTEERHQAACEQDYHATKGMDRGFTATEQRQYADGAKSNPGCHPPSIWYETEMQRGKRRELQDLLKESTL